MAESSAVAMDAIYRHQRYFYNVTRRYYLFGRDQMISNLSPPPGGKVLEIGCGTARNILQAAQQFPNAQYYGIDISEEMLKTANASVARSRFARSIKLAQADATAYSTEALFGVKSFDRIFISYALSMIPGWERVVEEALTKLSPRGELHIVDFGTMSGLPGPMRRAMQAWLAHFSVTPRADLGRTIYICAARQGLGAYFNEGRFGYAAHARISANSA